MKLSRMEIQRSLNERLDQVPLHGDPVERNLLGHLAEMEARINDARAALADVDPARAPQHNDGLKRAALFDVRDAIVAGFQALSQYGVPLGKRPEVP